MKVQKRATKIIKLYAHDYRNMAMNEIDLAGMLLGMIEALECDHQCTSNCRKESCRCDCGEVHF